MKQKLFTLFFALVASAGTIFAEVVIDGIAYNLNDETFTAEVTYGGAYTGEVVIPSSITYNQQVYSVTSIGSSAFYGCSGLTSVIIPENVTSIGSSAFLGCDNLAYVIMQSINPPSVWIQHTSTYNNSFNSQVPIYVPCGRLSAYQSAYSRGYEPISISYNVQYQPLAFNVEGKVNDPQMGTIIVPQTVCDGTIITATPNYGYHFAQWSDGITDNPRTFALTQDTTFTAIFDIDRSGTCGDNLTWDLINGILIIGGTGVMTDFTSQSVPWCISIKEITTVIIGNSVTSIGNYAFSGCSGLTSVSIGNSVTSIGNWAFSNCTGLTSIEIPNSVTSIGGSAFYNCSGLTSVTIPNGVTSIGDGAFSDCTSLTSIEIPNSVTSIVDGAFYGCSGLTSVTIPNSVTSIGRYAFWSCSGLTSITIPNSVTSIGEEAFYECTGLTSIIIPEGVTSIGNYLFGYCSNLKTIELPSTIVFNEYNYDIFGTGGSNNNGMPQLDTIRIAAGMLSYEEKNTTGYYHCRFTLAGFYEPNNYDPAIGNYDYTGVAWQNVKYVEAPYWFFDVPEGYWTKCPKSIEHVVVNRGELNDNILGVINRSYKTLKSLDVSAVTNVEFADEAFKGFYNLQTLALPEDLQRVSYMMVAGCKNLKSIDIPASVEEIDQSAFEDCRSLQTITFGGKQPAAVSGQSFAPAATTSNLKRIGNWAFYNAHELQHLEIPESVEEIGDAAFYGCVYLEDLVLPSSVQSIGDNCFALCSKLNKIIVSATTPPTIQAKTFYDVKRQIPVYVPDDCVDAYESDQYWSEFNIQGRSNVPTGIEDVTNDKSQMTNKVIKDGQIYILRGDKTYTITGQEIK